MKGGKVFMGKNKNMMGKALLEMKKVGKAFGKAAGEVGSAVGEAATNISTHTKKIAKVSMLKAEMDNLYMELGKSVFMDGLMPDNETAMNLMNVLFEKSDELEALERELAETDKSDETPSEDVKSECTCDGDCGEDCHCVDGECHCDEEVPCDCVEDETPAEESTSEDKEDTQE